MMNSGYSVIYKCDSCNATLETNISGYIFKCECCNGYLLKQKKEKTIKHICCKCANTFESERQEITYCRHCNGGFFISNEDTYDEILANTKMNKRYSYRCINGHKQQLLVEGLKMIKCSVCYEEMIG